MRRPRSKTRTATAPHISAGLAVVLVLSALTAEAAGPRRELYELSGKEMLASTARGISLTTHWRYRGGDDLAYAAHGFDDSAWTEARTRFDQSGTPEDWTGIGWYRLRLRVDEELRGTALALLVELIGAAEIYLDGELLYTVGRVDPDPEKAVMAVQRRPHLFAFDDRSEHVLAVRYCHHDPATLRAVERHGGFEARIGEANHRMAVYGRDLNSHGTYQAFFTGIFAAFALLHLLLYAFYPEAGENLWYALLTSSTAVSFNLFLHFNTTTDPAFFHVYERAMNVTWLMLSIFALGFVDRVFHDRTSGPFYAVVALAALFLIPGLIWPLAVQPFILMLVLVAFVAMCRIVVLALRHQKPGARIVGLGIVVLVAGFTESLLANLEILPMTLMTSFLMPLYSMTFLMLTMSIHLSRRFAQTSRDLRLQLIQVRELSEEKIEQERRTREEEVERARLEAAYQRKVSELEDARNLQLSMLPEHLPELPDLELAAGMNTATEVGGDYYDFDLAADGTLTVAIGDATGHGMRAGTMVTATKSLFNAMIHEHDLRATLGRFTHALKRMNLRRLSMALTLVKFKDGKLRLAAAGMPPALIYRAGTGTVESLLLEGAPLGSLTGFGYRETELELEPGDTVLLMSDGFPERLNHQDEMLGYDKALEAFTRTAPQPPQAIIEGLVEAGENWANGQPAQDDTTFVVLQRRGLKRGLAASAAKPVTAG